MSTVIDAVYEDKTDVNLDIGRRKYTITIKPSVDSDGKPTASFTTTDKDVCNVFTENGKYMLQLKDAYGNIITKEVTISEINTTPEP